MNQDATATVAVVFGRNIFKYSNAPRSQHFKMHISGNLISYGIYVYLFFAFVFGFGSLFGVGSVWMRFGVSLALKMSKFNFHN